MAGRAKHGTPRRAGWITLGIALLSALALAAPVAPAAGAEPESIASFTERPGDQVVTIPDGTYSGGEVTTDHPSTFGAYRGWLVLEAETPGGVVVDLAGGPLDLGVDASRMAFVGIKFVNGTVVVHGHDIAFWYTDHSFPAEEWVRQAPDPDRPQRGLYRAPRAINADDVSTHDVAFYGGDVHDTGTGLTVSRSTDVLLQGVRIWNLSDEGLDPYDVVHPDAIGLARGDTNGFTVRDSFIRGRITVIDAPGNLDGGGPHENLKFQDSWFTESPSAGFIFTSRKPDEPRGVFGTRVRIRSWAHGNGDDRTDIVEGEAVEPNSQPDRVNVTDREVVTEAPPTGRDDPATRWRRAQPYDSWKQVLFGLEAPRATSSTTTSVDADEDGPDDSGSTVIVWIGLGVAVAVVAGLGFSMRRRRRRRARGEF